MKFIVYVVSDCVIFVMKYNVLSNINEVGILKVIYGIYWC